MGVQRRSYRRLLIGSARLVGWCDSCGYLAQARHGHDDALLALLARHRAIAHGGATTRAGCTSHRPRRAAPA